MSNRPTIIQIICEQTITHLLLLFAVIVIQQINIQSNYSIDHIL